MKREVFQAFQMSTSEVFQTMIGLEVTQEPAEFCEQLHAQHEVSGIVGLSGLLAGDVIVSLDRDVAIYATAAMLGAQPSGLDNDVVDAVGELTNMIAGCAKAKLQQYNMLLALPTVIIGKEHQIGFKSGIDPINIPFTSRQGAFSVGIGLAAAEAPELAGVAQASQ